MLCSPQTPQSAWLNLADQNTPHVQPPQCHHPSIVIQQCLWSQIKYDIVPVHNIISKANVPTSIKETTVPTRTTISISVHCLQTKSKLQPQRAGAGKESSVTATCEMTVIDSYSVPSVLYHVKFGTRWWKHRRKNSMSRGAVFSYMCRHDHAWTGGLTSLKLNS